MVLLQISCSEDLQSSEHREKDLSRRIHQSIPEVTNKEAMLQMVNLQIIHTIITSRQHSQFTINSRQIVSKLTSKVMLLRRALFRKHCALWIVISIRMCRQQPPTESFRFMGNCWDFDSLNFYCWPNRVPWLENGRFPKAFFSKPRKGFYWWNIKDAI